MARPGAGAFAAALLIACAAAARVDHVEVIARAELAAGAPFGLAGSYERITARIHYKVRPGDAHEQAVVDLDKAPRDAAGEVAFSADLYLLKPRDPSRGNHALLLEIPNRGGKGILRIANGATPENEAGDGFLLEQGYVVAWIGWQADLPDDPKALRLTVPVARGADGPLRGPVRADFVVPARVTDHPLGHKITGRIGGKGYPVADLNSDKAVLTVRDAPYGQRRPIAREHWKFTDPATIHLDSGFEPGRIYEVVYEAQDPLVAGLGLAAVRDAISYFKHEADSIVRIERAYAVGISQSGRFLRHFLYQGFNADEHGKKVFDGIIAHVAGAGRGSFNHRFAQPSRDAQPTSSLYYPTDLYPFTGEALLEKPRASKTLPKIFFTNTSYEYWSRAASLIHTTPDGAADVTPIPEVRNYFLAGLQHFSGPFPPARGDQLDLRGQNLQNPIPVRWLWRALITDLDAWVRDATPPPPSAVPAITDGTLVELSRLSFPKLPGVAIPNGVLQAFDLDYGLLFSSGIITREPPLVKKTYATLVPQVDADGNDRGGVRLPEMEAPLATYTGWNLRDPSIGAPAERVSFIGSYLPFAKTAEERKRAGDPRPSIAERHHSRDEYMGRYTSAALALVKARFLRAEDLAAVLRRGEQEWAEATK